MILIEIHDYSRVKMVVPLGWYRYPSCLSLLRSSIKYRLHKVYMGLIIKGTIPTVPPLSLMNTELPQTTCKTDDQGCARAPSLLWVVSAPDSATMIQALIDWIVQVPGSTITTLLGEKYYIGYINYLVFFYLILPAACIVYKRGQAWTTWNNLTANMLVKRELSQSCRIFLQWRCRSSVAWFAPNHRPQFGK